MAGATRQAYTIEDKTSFWEYLYKRLRAGSDTARNPKGLIIWEEYLAAHPEVNRTANSITTHYRRQMQCCLHDACGLSLAKVVYLYKNLDLEVKNKKSLERRFGITVELDERRRLKSYTKGNNRNDGDLDEDDNDIDASDSPTGSGGKVFETKNGRKRKTANRGHPKSAHEVKSETSFSSSSTSSESPTKRWTRAKHEESFNLTKDLRDTMAQCRIRTRSLNIVGDRTEGNVIANASASPVSANSRRSGRIIPVPTRNIKGSPATPTPDINDAPAVTGMTTSASQMTDTPSRVLPRRDHPPPSPPRPTEQHVDSEPIQDAQPLMSFGDSPANSRMVAISSPVDNSARPLTAADRAMETDGLDDARGDVREEDSMAEFGESFAMDVADVLQDLREQEAANEGLGTPQPGNAPADDPASENNNIYPILTPPSSSQRAAGDTRISKTEQEIRSTCLNGIIDQLSRELASSLPLVLVEELKKQECDIWNSSKSLDGYRQAMLALCSKSLQEMAATDVGGVPLTPQKINTMQDVSVVLQPVENNLANVSMATRRRVVESACLRLSSSAHSVLVKACHWIAEHDRLVAEIAVSEEDYTKRMDEAMAHVDSEASPSI